MTIGRHSQSRGGNAETIQRLLKEQESRQEGLASQRRVLEVRAEPTAWKGEDFQKLVPRGLGMGTPLTVAKGQPSQVWEVLRQSKEDRGWRLRGYWKAEKMPGRRTTNHRHPLQAEVAESRVPDKCSGKETWKNISGFLLIAEAKVSFALLKTTQRPLFHIAVFGLFLPAIDFPAQFQHCWLGLKTFGVACCLLWFAILFAWLDFFPSVVFVWSLHP